MESQDSRVATEHAHDKPQDQASNATEGSTASDTSNKRQTKQDRDKKKAERLAARQT